MTESTSKVETGIKPETELTSIQLIENQHQKENYLKHDNIKFDLKLFFGGKKRMDGELILATNSSKGVIKLENGNKVYLEITGKSIEWKGKKLRAATVRDITKSKTFEIHLKLMAKVKTFE